MSVSMNQVDAIMDLFQHLQDQNNHHGEIENVVQLKWDMRKIMNQIGSKDEMVQLVKFFMYYSDDRSFKEFGYNYNHYYEKMIEVKNDRLHRRWLQNQTLEKYKEREEGTQVES